MRAFPAGILFAAVASAGLLRTERSISVQLQRSVDALHLGKTPHKTAYFGRLEVGSPRQEFSVLFDTGSGAVVLPGIDCSSPACTKHRRYDPSQSSSSEKVQEDGTTAMEGTHRDVVAVQFGTGEIDGVYVKDEVCVGKLCARPRLVAATSETDAPFSDFEFDGILGLGLPDKDDPSTSFVHALFAAKMLRSPIFAVYLADSGPSEVTFGATASGKHDGPFVYMPVVGDSGFWQVDVADVAVNHAPLKVGAVRAALDSGTSQIATPTTFIVAIVTAIDVAADCSNLDSLPKLGFVMGDKILDLDPADYVDSTDGKCELALMPMDIPPPQGPMMVLGEPFMRKFYTVYDAGDRQVGFAPARQAGRAPASLVSLSEEF